MSKPRLAVFSSFVAIITVLVGFSVGTAQAPIVPRNSSPGLPKKGEQKALRARMTTTDGRALSDTPIQQQQESQERPSRKSLIGLDIPPDEYFNGGGLDETSSTLLTAAQAAESVFRIFEKLGLSNRVEVVLYATTHMQQSSLVADGSIQKPVTTNDQRSHHAEQG